MTLREGDAIKAVAASSPKFINFSDVKWGIGAEMSAVFIETLWVACTLCYTPGVSGPLTRINACSEKN